MTRQPSNHDKAVAALRAHRQVPEPWQTRAACDALARYRRHPTYVGALIVVDVVETEVARYEDALVDEAVAASRRAAGRKRAAMQADVNAAEVRAWCKAQGIPCPERGRYLPAHVLDKWRAHRARME